MSMRESLLLLIRLPLCILPSASSTSAYFVRKNFQTSYVILSMRQSFPNAGTAWRSCKQQALPNHGEVTERMRYMTTRGNKRSTQNEWPPTGSNKHRGQGTRKRKRSRSRKHPYGTSGTF